MARYFRKNKYGESITVEKYTCGSCALYDIDTGRCDKYEDSNNHPFPRDDSCRGYWTEAGDIVSY